MFEPDYYVEYLPDNPWIHQPFEVYDTLRPEDAAGAPRGRVATARAAPVPRSRPPQPLTRLTRSLQADRGERASVRSADGAQKRTRTSTVLPPLGPEPSASTNSAIWATATCNFTFRARSLSKKPTPPCPPRRPRAAHPRRRRAAARRASRAPRSPDARRASAQPRRPAAAAPSRRHRPELSRRASPSSTRCRRRRPAAAGELERELAVDPRAREAFDGRLAAMQRDGQLLVNRKGELCVVAKLDLITGTRAGPSGRLRLPRARRRRRRPLPVAARDAQGAARRPRARRGASAPTGAAGPRARSSTCSSAPTATVVGRLYEERGIWFVVAENRRINQDLLVPPDERGSAKAGRRRRRRDRRAARRRSARRSRA